MSVSLVPRDASSTRRPEDVIEFRGTWLLEKRPEVIEARLFWFTRGKGTEDVGIIAIRDVPPSAVGEETFRFRLPDAPYSFSGRLITLQWAVELVADDEVARWEFTMSRTGEEVILHAQPADARR